MLRKIKLLCKFVIISTLFSQYLTQTDSIWVNKGDIEIQFDKSFILDSTITCISDSTFIYSSFDNISGKAILAKPALVSKDYTFTYKYLSNPPPKIVQLELPKLENKIRQTQLNKERDSLFNQSQSIGNSILSAGTFHRQLTASQQGGSEMTGGMQFQLQGALGNDIQVSGIISDQDFPIQPDGSSQSLDDIDQVFIQIEHPKFNVEVGDITFSEHLGKLNHYERNIIGIKNNFNSERIQMNGLLSKTKSRYYTIEFKGKDGMQGPYQLVSDNGNRQIIIQAGTEKVWLNGNAMIRGNNQDYTIDYHTGELIFTSKHLIHHDSDILVEYQYSDFQYTRNLLGGSITGELKNKGNISLHLYRENDAVSNAQQNWPSDVLTELIHSGDGESILNGITPDTLGNYIWEDSILVYVGDESDVTVDDRVSVIFRYDEDGSYTKNISSRGRVYYEYAHNIQDSDITYSPGQKIVKPENNTSVILQSTYALTHKMNLHFELGQSIHDKNIISSLDDKDNVGYSTYFELNRTLENQNSDHPTIEFKVSDWNTTSQYNSFNRLTDITFKRDWNLHNDPTDGFHLSSGDIVFNHPRLGQTQLNVSKLQNTWMNKNKYFFHQSIQKTVFNGAYVLFSQVKDQNQPYFQQDLFIPITIKQFQPFIQYKSERDMNFKAFKSSSFGLTYEKNHHNWTFQSIYREDESEMDSLNSGLELFQKGWFINGDYFSRPKSGWRRGITIRKRLQHDQFSAKEIDYLIGQIQLSFRDGSHPIQWDMQLNSEEILKEYRIVVYDSVGPGIGHYRYDAHFNDYILDPNGSYIVQSIPSGELEQISSITGNNRFQFQIDKSKWKYQLPLTIRIENKLDYHGDIYTIKNIFTPIISNESVRQSRWMNKINVDFNPMKSKTRVQAWSIFSRDMNGHDPRGNELRNTGESAILIEKMFNEQLRIETNSSWDSFEVESDVSTLRNRIINGWWQESSITYLMNQGKQLSLGIQSGNGRGTYGSTSFQANGWGITLKGKLLINKKGKIESQIKWNTVSLLKGDILPPESLNGNPAGTSFRSNTRFQWMIDNRISLILNLQTINDNRYGILNTFNGEFRAYF